MSDGPEWFAPKRYGYGSGLPLSWQGWVLMLAYTAAVIALAWQLQHRPLELAAAVIPLTMGLMVICAKTTRGGWRWRWGTDDSADR